jgi:hypothetical protein
MKTYKARMFLRLVEVLAFAVAAGNLAHSQSCNVEWTGNAGDGLWSTAGNWSTNHVPGPTSDVCIVAAPPTPNCAPAGCIDASAIPSVSVNSILVDQGSWLELGSGTVSTATSITVQGQEAGGGAYSGVLLEGTNLNAPSLQVGDSSYRGTLEGHGTVDGSITNNGYIRADFALKVTGNYTQASGAELFEEWPQATIAPGELTQGLLQVNGTATLSGHLGVGTDAPKHPPQTGSTYTVMTFGSLSGKFTSVSTPISLKYNQNNAVATYK